MTSERVIKKAPVPVRGRYWFDCESREEFIENLRHGWGTDMSDAEDDIREISDPIGYLLSNGQTVIVRAKK